MLSAAKIIKIYLLTATFTEVFFLKQLKNMI